MPMCYMHVNGLIFQFPYMSILTYDFQFLAMKINRGRKKIRSLPYLDGGGDSGRTAVVAM